VSTLIAGPTVFICDICIDAAEAVMRGTKRGRGELRTAERGSRVRCSLCRKRADEERSLVVGPANVCSECRSRRAIRTTSVYFLSPRGASE
jgi:hypothetical protein